MPRDKKVKKDTIDTCPCDMKYIATGNGLMTIKWFFKHHPFVCGILTGFIFREGADTFAQVLEEVVKENYRKRGGWGAEGCVSKKRKVSAKVAGTNS